MDFGNTNQGNQGSKGNEQLGYGPIDLDMFNADAAIVGLQPQAENYVNVEHFRLAEHHQDPFFFPQQLGPPPSNVYPFSSPFANSTQAPHLPPFTSHSIATTQGLSPGLPIPPRNISRPDLPIPLPPPTPVDNSDILTHLLEFRIMLWLEFRVMPWLKLRRCGPCALVHVRASPSFLLHSLYKSFYHTFHQHPHNASGQASDSPIPSSPIHWSPTPPPQARTSARQPEPQSRLLFSNLGPLWLQEEEVEEAEKWKKWERWARPEKEWK
ncbi:hypothetical protein MMC31_006177 [Peltigera leucophlebia]|nr:hypothetical protein [Peltigera leucophlebia]